MDKAIEKLAKDIWEHCGDCPADRYNWEPPFDCAERCKREEEWKCWVVWAKGEEEVGDG